MTPGYEDAKNASGAIVGVPDKKDSQDNSAKVVPKLTQSLVEDKRHSRTGVVTSEPKAESENVKGGIGPAYNVDHDKEGANNINLTKIDEESDQVVGPEALNSSQSSPNRDITSESVNEHTDYCLLRFPKGKWPIVSGKQRA